VGTAAGAGASSSSTQAVRIKAAADSGLSGSSGADGGWGSPDSDTEGFGTTVPDQATAILASSTPSGASPPTDAGIAATADAGVAGGAATAAVRKPNDPIETVPVVDDQGNPILIPDGPYKGKPMLRPAGLDPHFFVNQGTTDKSYYGALINNPSPNPLGGGGAGPAILPREFMQLSKFNQGGEWDVPRVGGKFHPEYVDYATVAIGLYTASSGISRDEILCIQDAFRSKNSNSTMPASKVAIMRPCGVDNADRGQSLRNVQTSKSGHRAASQWCEPPGGSTRIAALSELQAPNRDYPMSTHALQRHRRMHFSPPNQPNRKPVGISRAAGRGRTRCALPPPGAGRCRTACRPAPPRAR